MNKKELLNKHCGEFDWCFECPLADIPEACTTASKFKHLTIKEAVNEKIKKYEDVIKELKEAIKED